MVYNVMEEVARDILSDMLMDGYEGCTCGVCQDDMLAIALNRLPPQYSSRRTGETYVKARLFADQWKVDVIRELTRAAEIVRNGKLHP